jgi:chromosome segregation ATPase
MLTKILLILAILAGIAAVILGFTQVKPKVEKLQGDLVDVTKERIRQEKRAVKAEKDFARTTGELKDERTAHDATRRERETAKSERDAAIAQGKQLQAKIETLTSELTASKQELNAWANLGIPVEKIKEMIAQLKEQQQFNEALQGENKILAQKLKSREDYIKILLGEKTYDDEEGIPMAPGLKARVVSVDPKWNFVVLDIGKNQEAMEGGNMLIYRDGKLISKVKIRTVTETNSVATIMRGWKLVDIQEGDLALYREVKQEGK